MSVADAFYIMFPPASCNSSSPRAVIGAFFALLSENVTCRRSARPMRWRRRGAEHRLQSIDSGVPGCNGAADSMSTPLL